MGDCPPYVYACFHSFRLACLALLLASSIVLQILACALYQNWWPMLTVIMYVMVPMPCLFFGGGSTLCITSRDVDDGDSIWSDLAKFLNGFSVIGSIAIPTILLHANIIKVGAMLLQLSSFFLLVFTILMFNHVSREDDW